MVICVRCEHKIDHGDEYMIAYNEIYCAECAEDLGFDNETFIRDDGRDKK